MAGGQVDPEPLLDLRHEVSGGYEQGLLSLAFHPRFEENRTFFVYYTDRQGTVRVVRFRAFPDRYTADPSSRTEILAIPQPAANHNGGMMAFGPDGYLYIATGDGGRGGDPWGNAQNLARCWERSCASTWTGASPYTIPPDNPFVGAHGRPARDLGLRLAQSVAVLLRPGDRRPVHRRRRPGELGGGELCARGEHRG